MDQAISWFDIAHINKGASRIDFEKLANLNAKYIDASSTDRLLELMTPGIEEKTGQPLSDDIRGRLDAGMDSLKSRAQTIPQLIDNSLFYFSIAPYIIMTTPIKYLTMTANPGSLACYQN